MARYRGDPTDDSYAVDIGTVRLSSLPEITSPASSCPSVPGLTLGSFVSQRCPISKASPQIRVLDLQKSRHFDDPLVGKLEVVSLDQSSASPFTALSYAWGASQSVPGETIDLGIGQLPITTNCADALRQIRQLPGSTEIWVDSICIDQSSVAERCHQVALMGDVYSKAGKVYIWLGQDTPGIRRALKWIEFAASFLYLPLDSDALAGAYQRTKFELKLIRPVMTLKLLRDQLKRDALLRSYRQTDLEELLRLPWFSRIWTFQEVVLASDAVILCGNATLSWSVFTRGFRCLEFLFTDTRSLLENTQEIDGEMIMLRQRSTGTTRTIRGQEEVFERKCTGARPDFDSRPCGYLALQRVIFFWMRADRKGLRRNNSPEVEGESTILRHQTPYINMWNRHVEAGGRFWVRLAAVLFPVGVGLLVALLLPFLFYGRQAYGMSAVIIGALASFMMLCSILFCVMTSKSFSFHPERSSTDLGMNRPKQRVSDQLISAVITTLCYRQATEPKDMSYGLYGALRSFGVELAALDYSKPKSQIYYELCLDMLTFRASAINILMYVNQVQPGQTSIDTGTEKSPTWVPDWSRLEPKQFVALGTSGIPECYSSTKQGTTPFFKLSRDKKAIFVSGHWKGDIAFCMGGLQVIADEPPRFLTKSDPMHTSIQAFSGWVGALRRLVFAKFQVIRLREGRCRCAFDQWSGQCNCGPRGAVEHPAAAAYAFLKQRGRPKKPDHDFLRFRKVYDIFAQEKQDGGPASREMTTQAAQDILNSLLGDDLLGFFVEIINGQARNDSRWFITSDGYLGCGTASVMLGDRLALVGGVAAPMVLRPLDSEMANWFHSPYMAVCSAYVLGWMYGEVFDRDQVRIIRIL